jgi:DNA invertase Pin-like site-specific DNA recombinase
VHAFGQQHEGKPLIRAAEYVRMSTEHQQYSTVNQSEVIRSYARGHSMEVVRTYSDEGKSGLTLHRREGLRSLLEDVESRKVDFSAVLVYDVTRWGRFQDVDESAYYEYRCRKAKVAVHYCAELFPNDGSISSAVLKTIKRMMAAEYSRELSTKVFAGKCRLAEMGFRQGGHAGYGLRRMLIDQTGTPKGFLRWGERKSIFTDRVILVPGPDEEVKVVREIFRLFIGEKLFPKRIAERLNEKGIPSETGRPWTRYMICDMLSNPKYIGCNVTNRTSMKLRTALVRNPREMWVKRENAFEPIIDIETFRQAEELTKEHTKRYTNEELLDCLKDLLARKGRLSVDLIDHDSATPSGKIYQERFGGVLEAYRLIDYQTHSLCDAESVKHTRRFRAQWFARLKEELTLAGATIRPVQGGADSIEINGEFTLGFSVARCRGDTSADPMWEVRLRSGDWHPDVRVIARFAPGAEQLLDYYVVPRMALFGGTFRVKLENSFDRDVFRFDDLHFLKSLCKRSPIEERP